jgi:hypothetical protein
MCTSGVRQFATVATDSAKSAGKEYASRMEAEKSRIEDTNLSGKAMEEFEGGMRSIDGAIRPIGEEAQRWGDAAASIMGMGKPEKQAAQSDTQEANYSKSSSEKSSQTKSKAKKKGGEGTGGSKAQFYAKK